MLKRNMVYGVLGIRVDHAMLNASFQKTAKQNSEGEMYASPQSMGFAIKEQMAKDGLAILGRRRVDEKGVLGLKEAFEKGFTEEERATFKAENPIKKALMEKYEDIMQFGNTFTVKGYPTFGMTGATQIGFAVNKYSGTEELISEILPCFSAENAKEKAKQEAKAAKGEQIEEKLKSNTLGEQYILDKANFLYSFTICPFQYDDFTDVIEGFEGYTEEHYERFKKASIKAISNLNTKSKKGCTNEFALFVETNDKVKDNIDLNELDEYITVDRSEGKVIYNIENLASLLNDVKDEIKSVEIYYDHRTMSIVGRIENAKLLNIKTRKVIEQKGV